MNKKSKLMLGVVFLVVLLVFTSLSSAYTRSSPQLTNPGMGGIFGSGNVPSAPDEDMCQKGQDFILSVAPEGCSPKVVRSDMLEEQNQPVFCPITATKINPLIQVKAIDWISVQDSELSEHVASVGYHPNRGALQGFSTGFQGEEMEQPQFLNKVGYIVVNLKRTPVEDNMPDYVSGNLTARISYDVENAFGLGDAQMRLETMNDDEWENNFERNRFWGGRGYLRAENVQDEGATVSIYSGNTRVSGESEYRQRVQSTSLREGETSNKIYLPSVDMCLGSMTLDMRSLENPGKTASLDINGRETQVKQGESFLREQCTLRSVDSMGMKQIARISCTEDLRGTSGERQFGGRRKNLELSIDPRVNLTVEGKGTDSYRTGDILYSFDEENENSDRRVFLGYIGQKGQDKTPFILPVVSTANTRGEFLDNYFGSDMINSYGRYVSSDAYNRTGISMTRSMVKSYNHIISAGGGVEVAEPIFIGPENGKEPTFFYEFARNTFYETLTPSFWNSVGRKLWGSVWGSDMDEEETEELLEDLYTKRKITFNNISEGGNMELREDIRKNYEKAMQDFESLRNDFSNVQEREGSRPYGMRSLARQIELAKSTKQMATVEDLCEEYEESYPEDANITGLVSTFEICDDDLKLSNSNVSSESVFIDEQSRQISFEGTDYPDFEEYGVRVQISQANESYNGEYTLSLNGRTYLSDSEYIELAENGLTEDSATFNVYANNSGLFGTPQASRLDKVTIGLDDYEFVGADSYRLDVEEINLDKVAVVGINAQQNYQSSTSNLSFKVGIDKRDIQMTPQRTRERIEDVNSSIETWKKASDALGKTVEGFKKACFATGTVLTAKNFLENAFGNGTGGLARQQVMNGDGGWEQKCTEMVNQGEYGDIQECYLDNADQIDEDVESLKNKMNQQDQDIKDIQENYKLENNTLSGDMVNTSGFKKDYSQKVAEKLGNNWDLVEQANQQSSDDEELNQDSLLRAFEEGYDQNIFTIDKLKEVDLYLRAAQDNANERNLKRLYGSLRDVQENTDVFDKRQSVSNDIEGGSQSINTVGSNVEGTRELEYRGLTVSGVSQISPDGFGPENPVGAVQDVNQGGVYYYILNGSAGTDKLPVARDDGDNMIIYNSNGERADASQLSDYMTRITFKEYDRETYQNRYIGSSTGEEVVVRYYDSSSFEGMPAVVPFSQENGWYAYVEKDLSREGSSTRSYDQSGRPNNFRLCNVGDDGIENAFSRTSDDICQVINVRSSGTYRNFNGLSSDQTTKLVDAALQAIEEAGRQRQSGSPDKVEIPTLEGGTWKLPIGEPATGSPGFTCQDFMSPKECNLIFNVCDPVVCPNDRCDFGGKFPVRDVQQSGVVGSALLCMPNFPEVKVPMCLSGIHGGMKNIISVKESYRSCLQESLETGKTVGICDQIRSVYLCDFAWKQAEPLVREGVEFGAQQVSGGTPAQGGGEYRNVDNAISSAEESVQYFTQEYGINSNNAFQSRSTQDIGGKLCKGFLSAPGAKIGTAFDEVTQPDSPAQFHGRLNSETYSTVTNPPMSHYKIFYHIYAGDQRGAYYKVYLRQGEGGTFYEDTSGLRQIDGGYISSGEKVTQTVDRRLPSGYGELCINVNGRQECGFKKASTSFAQNWMSDRYVQDQAENKNIRSEQECISGSASAFNALNSNPQAGAQNAMDPQIYQSGLTRICAEKNPGESAPNDRWVDVGHCGNPEMRCWLDQQSIDESIDNEFIQNQTLNETENIWRDQINDSDDYITQRENFYDRLEDILDGNRNIEELEPEQIREILEQGELGNLLDQVVFNDLKADVLFERGKGYAILATDLFGDWIDELMEERSDGEGGESDQEVSEQESDEGRSLPSKAGQCESPKFQYDWMGAVGEFFYNPLPWKSGTADLCFKYMNEEWHWTGKCDYVGTTVTKEDVQDKGWTVEKEKKIKWISVNNDSAIEDRNQGTYKPLTSTSINWLKSLRGKDYPGGLKVFLDDITKNGRDANLILYESTWNHIARNYIPMLYDGTGPDGARRELTISTEGVFNLVYTIGTSDGWGNNLIKFDYSAEYSEQDGWKWSFSGVRPERIISKESALDHVEAFNSTFEKLEGKEFVEGASLLITQKEMPACFGGGYGSCSAYSDFTCSANRKKSLVCGSTSSTGDSRGTWNWNLRESCDQGEFCNPERGECVKYFASEGESPCSPLGASACSQDGKSVMSCQSATGGGGPAAGVATAMWTESQSCGQGEFCSPQSSECVSSEELSSSWRNYYQNSENPFGGSSSGSGGSSSSSSGSTSGNVPSGFDCSSSQECKERIARGIYQLAVERVQDSSISNKDKVFEQNVKDDTNYNSFMCLAVGQALQESSLKHCKNPVDNGNAVYCGYRNENSNMDEVLISRIEGEDSHGAMQINPGPFGENPGFRDNVETALDKLINEYKANSGGKQWQGDGNVYRGWRAALRGYNGWGQGGDPDYISHILENSDEVGQYIEQCK